ncbi:hypothetical protein CCHR01_11636 [Colletotrichum chrysophilum]|uniref:Uncharacterized protein n=1 Tax=Colletotrichum chrysophilum TaxID=1836956 RepID=A0AAD9ACP2_9PEZI|nr:hypothetical protein K456DRAFT_47732 [Colletotrichum gloeosporioides 23]KAK1845726.1 hypothetical protein CCHR01_11636 [Colletotrichum chrysophilum]
MEQMSSGMRRRVWCMAHKIGLCVDSLRVTKGLGGDCPGTGGRIQMSDLQPGTRC